MNQPRLVHRRSLLTGLLAVGLVPLAGCMSKPVRPANADGTYCYAVGRSLSRKLTCTTAPIPSQQVEAEAKRFEATPGLLTVYVVRKRWGDARNVVRLTVDRDPAVATVPESFVRLRLKPGAHQMVAEWDEGRAALDITGKAGEVVFVELIGSVWSWGSSYRLESGNPAESRARALGLRLVADIG
ncbi:hypothetical protein KAK06_02125 [Ideonella sp. 4Y11]|uniref:DUF2846 domain-containing protein n=1 Tax=Ideonella aquatica TaxID=2824119 RepID=A0A940YKL2_9BURK|nr:hypothetical protein [Ideonella aquatica]MBN8486938.1 hypothetical protein [Burkholderiales bacterium]MBQ0957743.1 hypothetical protein [Ideonella aquatica]